MESQDLYREHKKGSGSEQRITNIITEHWNKLRGSKIMPSEKDLDPNLLEGILDNCFLIKAKEFALAGKHNYVYIGKNILEAYGSHVTSPKDYHNIDPLSHKHKFEEILEKCKPVLDEGEFTNQDGHLVKYRQCLVPLSNDGHTIDSIFGGMRFKVFK